jgi:hypothetical protein
MKSLQDGFVSLALLVLALLLVGGGVYVYSKNKSADLSTRNVVTTQSVLTDDDFIKAIDIEYNGGAKVVARGDINMDGYEDAVVQTTSCGASCGSSLFVVFNVKDESTKVYVSQTGAFESAYNGSGAAQSVLSSVVINNGVITLTGNGLNCYMPNTETPCTEEKWNMSSSVQYTYKGGRIVEIN